MGRLVTEEVDLQRIQLPNVCFGIMQCARGLLVADTHVLLQTCSAPIMQERSRLLQMGQHPVQGLLTVSERGAKGSIPRRR